jgi:hypothetical protein
MAGVSAPAIFIHGEKIMQAYIGAKIINAEPYAKGDEPGYRIVYPDGYVSWSPKAVFEEAYRPISVGEHQIMRRGAVHLAATGSFYDRLLAEQKELHERIGKLGPFIDSAAFRDLDERQRELLVEQYDAMTRYSGALDERVRTIAPPETRSTARQSNKPNEEIGEGVRMIGSDQSEEPVPFKG